MVSGGGYLSQTSADNQFLTASGPVANAQSWSVASKSVHDSTQASLQSYVVAIFDPYSTLDVNITTAQFASPANNGYGAVNLPAGYLLTGGGVSTSPSNSYGLMIYESFPTGSKNTSTDVSSQGWAGAAIQPCGDCSGNVNVFAIGVKWSDQTNKPALVSSVSNAQTANTGAPTGTAAPPSNSTLVGGGASTGNVNSMLQDCYPSVDSDSNPVWSATSHGAATPCSVTLNVYAVGLSVMWYPSAGGAGKLFPFGGPNTLVPPTGYQLTQVGS